jgi:hypothetical protein
VALNHDLLYIRIVSNAINLQIIRDSSHTASISIKVSYIKEIRTYIDHSEETNVLTMSDTNVILYQVTHSYPLQFVVYHGMYKSINYYGSSNFISCIHAYRWNQIDIQFLSKY